MYFWIRFISLMGKIAGYLTEKRGGYDQKDAQSIDKNNGKITKQAVCKKSKQFLRFMSNFDVAVLIPKSGVECQNDKSESLFL